MTLEESIRTALVHENRVAAAYEVAADAAGEGPGRRVLQALAREERFHIRYLEKRLSEWTDSGRLSDEKLETVIPPYHEIEARAASMRRTLNPTVREPELQVLKRALDVEIETNEFYKRMVAGLDGEGRALYARFVEVEEGHRRIVEAEIDSLSKSGFWFDFRETDVED